MADSLDSAESETQQPASAVDADELLLASPRALAATPFSRGSPRRLSELATSRPRSAAPSPQESPAPALNREESVIVGEDELRMVESNTVDAAVSDSTSGSAIHNNPSRLKKIRRSLKRPLTSKQLEKLSVTEENSSDCQSSEIPNRSIDATLQFCIEDRGRILCGTISRIFHYYADRLAAAAELRAEHDLLRQDVEAFFITFKSAGITPEYMFHILVERYRSAPSSDSSTSAQIAKQRTEVREGAMLMLARWVAAAPSDFFEEPESTSDFSSSSGGTGSPNITSSTTTRSSSLFQSSSGSSTQQSLERRPSQDARLGTGDAWMTSGKLIRQVTSLKPTVHAFLSSAEHRRYRKLASNVMKNLDQSRLPRRDPSGDLMNEDIAFVGDRSQSRSSDNLSSPDSRQRNNSLEVDPSVTVRHLSPLVVAQHMSIIERRRLLAVAEAPRGLLGQRWARTAPRGTANDAPGTQQAEAVRHGVVESSIAWFNCVSRWVAVDIVTAASAVERGARLARWIEICEHLRQLNNYNGVFQVLSALHSSPISRLKRSWQQVPGDQVAVFDKLTELCSPRRNYRVLRRAIDALGVAVGPADEPCLPYMGLVLSDLTFIDDANPNFVAPVDIATPSGPLSQSLVDKQALQNRRSIDTPRDAPPKAPDFVTKLFNMEKARLNLSVIRRLRNGVTPQFSFPEIAGTAFQIASAVNDSAMWDERTLTQVSKLREPNATSQRRSMKIPTPTDIGVRQQVPTTRISLHQHDHRLLRVGAEMIRLPKAGMVVEQTKFFQRHSLYVVQRGVVRLEAGGPIAGGARWAVAERHRDEFFGHCGFLGVGISSDPWVRAVAAEDKTEILRLDTTYLTTLLSSKPRLALRLYQNIGFDLAGLLRALPVIAASIPEYSDTDAVATSTNDSKPVDKGSDLRRVASKSAAEAVPSLLPGLRRLRQSNDANGAAAAAAAETASSSKVPVRSISSTGPRSLTSDGRLTGQGSLRKSRRKRILSGRFDKVLSSNDNKHDSSQSSAGGNDDDDNDDDANGSGSARSSDSLRRSARARKPALPTAAVDIVQRVVNERYNLEFNLHDEELIEEVSGYATRRAGMWHKTTVLLSAHYLCLRTPLFGVVSRTSISLFDVVDIHLPAPGSIVLEARNKKIYHLRRRRRKKGARGSTDGSESGATSSVAASGNDSNDEPDQDDLGALVSSIWAALPKIRYGDHQRHMAMATGDGSVAGRTLDDSSARQQLGGGSNTNHLLDDDASTSASDSKGGKKARPSSTNLNKSPSSLVVRLSMRRHRSKSKTSQLVSTPPRRTGGDTLRGTSPLGMNTVSTHAANEDADDSSYNGARRTTPTFVSAAKISESESSTATTTHSQSHSGTSHSQGHSSGHDRVTRAREYAASHARGSGDDATKASPSLSKSHIPLAEEIQKAELALEGRRRALIAKEASFNRTARRSMGPGADGSPLASGAEPSENSRSHSRSLSESTEEYSLSGSATGSRSYRGIDQSVVDGLRSDDSELSSSLALSPRRRRPGRDKNFSNRLQSRFVFGKSRSPAEELISEDPMNSDNNANNTPDNLSLGLSEADWELLLSGAKTTRYAAGESILTQGEPYQCLMHVVTGTCRVVQVDAAGESRVWTQLKGGQMFGEVTFLAGGRATASVVAHTPVELYRIEGYYIHILFRLKDGLAGRFYHLIASVLAGRIVSTAGILFARRSRRHARSRARERRSRSSSGGVSRRTPNSGSSSTSTAKTAMRRALVTRASTTPSTHESSSSSGTHSSASPQSDKSATSDTKATAVVEAIKFDKLKRRGSLGKSGESTNRSVDSIRHSGERRSLHSSGEHRHHRLHRSNERPLRHSSDRKLHSSGERRLHNSGDKKRLHRSSSRSSMRNGPSEKLQRLRKSGFLPMPMSSSPQAAPPLPARRTISTPKQLGLLLDVSSTDEHGANDDEDIDIDALVGVSSDDDDLAPSPGADVAELERLFAASDRAMPSMKHRSHSREDSVDALRRNRSTPVRVGVTRSPLAMSADFATSKMREKEEKRPRRRTSIDKHTLAQSATMEVTLPKSKSEGRRKKKKAK